MSNPRKFQFRDHSSEVGTDQPANGYSARQLFGERLSKTIKELGVTAAEVAERSGIPRSTLSRYVNGESQPKSEHIFPLADALLIDPRWLITGGSSRTQLLAADEAEWVDIPEYDLRELTDESLGDAISTTPMRKDWLNQTLGQWSGIWLARLPADLPRLDLREGDLVFLRTLADGEPPKDGGVYIVRVHGHLTVARLDSMMDSVRHSIAHGLEERRLAFRHLGHEDGQAEPLARVLGAPVKRI